MAYVDDVEKRSVDEHLNLNSWVIEEGKSDHHKHNSPQYEDHAVRDNIVSVCSQAKVQSADAILDTRLSKLLSIFEHDVEEK